MCGPMCAPVFESMRNASIYLCCSLLLAVLVACAHDGSQLTGTSRSNSTKTNDAGAPKDEEDGDGDPSDSIGPVPPKGTKDGGSKGPACMDPSSPPGDGHHNEGKDCLSCHEGMAGASWTVAGTLYGSEGDAVSGATIEVTDANGKVILLVSCDNGNFYTDEDVAFPVKVRATSCPDNQRMVGAAPQGSCNAGGCHEDGNRVHL
jgi:hypothetical protein